MTCKFSFKFPQSVLIIRFHEYFKNKWVQINTKFNLHRINHFISYRIDNKLNYKLGK